MAFVIKFLAACTMAPIIYSVPPGFNAGLASQVTVLLDSSGPRIYVLEAAARVLRSHHYLLQLEQITNILCSHVSL